MSIKRLDRMLLDNLTGSFGQRATITGGVPTYKAMLSDFENAIVLTKYFEGGYSSDRRDSGNWSSGIAYKGTFIGSTYGVGAPALITFLGYVPTAAYMKDLPPAVYEQIAQKHYYVPCGADLLPRGINIMAFDYGWNRGVGTSVKLLQRAVGAPIDGVYGRTTEAAIDKYIATWSVQALITLIQNMQLAEYKTLYNYDIYGNGWTARTNEKTAFALSMIEDK